MTAFLEREHACVVYSDDVSNEIMTPFSLSNIEWICGIVAETLMKTKMHSEFANFFFFLQMFLF